jgi:hypothetical protein
MNRRFMALAVVGLALSACASKPTISSQTTRGANLSAYTSYAWVNAPPPGGMNPVAWERVKQDVDSALTAKGYTQADPGALAVILTIGARNKTDINTYGWWGRQVSVYQYTEGKISIDVFDAKTKQPLWHGQATQTIDPGNPNEALIDTAVAGVMANFPART